MNNFLMFSAGLAGPWPSSAMLNVSQSTFGSPDILELCKDWCHLSFLHLTRVSVAEKQLCSVPIGRSKCWRFVLICTVVEFNSDKSVICGSSDCSVLRDINGWRTGKRGKRNLDKRRLCVYCVGRRGEGGGSSGNVALSTNMKLACLLTYLLTYLFHGGESFLRS
jgi:hypothetical protein